MYRETVIVLGVYKRERAFKKIEAITYHHDFHYPFV